MSPRGDSFRSDEFYIQEIERLRKEKNTIILAHNYQRAEIQDIADYVGDSLGLSQKAAETTADIIVFCGVRFMAETAAILSPEKTVILPEPEAGCPMADMVTADALRKKKAEHQDAVVVCYVNSSADVKAESDICCTSSNAISVIESVDKNKEIIFVPDEHLARFVSSETGREIIYWPGFCPTHLRVTTEDIIKMKKEHPKAKVVVHPECEMNIIALADRALSTGGILNYASESDAEEFIIGTELGLMHRLEKLNPNKKFYLASNKMICPNMKLTTLESLAESMKSSDKRITVPEDIRRKATHSLERMLSLSECLVK